IGLGSSSSFSSAVSESSSSMISLHRSMHSSQMYTPGPAISFLTCFWDLPQNEHFSRSESPNFAMPPDSSAHSGPGSDPAGVPTRSLRRLGRRCRKFPMNFPAGNDLVDQAVVLRLLGGHDEVPVGVLRDLFQGLAGVLGQELVEQLTVSKDL